MDIIGQNGNEGLHYTNAELNGWKFNTSEDGKNLIVTRDDVSEGVHLEHYAPMSCIVVTALSKNSLPE